MMRNYAPSRGLLQVFLREGQWVESAKVQFEHPNAPKLRAFNGIGHLQGDLNFKRTQQHGHPDHRVEVMGQARPSHDIIPISGTW